MRCRYGIVILALLFTGSLGNTEIYFGDEGIRAERRFGRTFRNGDREIIGQEQTGNGELSRLLTEFGGVHVSRLLKDLGGLTGAGINEGLRLGMNGLSSITAIFGGLGGSDVAFNDISRLLTEVERRGFRRGDGGRGMRDDMIEVIRLMKEETENGANDVLNRLLENERILMGEEEIRKGISGGLADGGGFGIDGIREEDFQKILEALLNENTKDTSTSPTNQVVKEGRRKEETGGRGRHFERVTERVNTIGAPILHSIPENIPGGIEQGKGTSENLNDISELLHLLEQIEQIESRSRSEGSGRTNQEIVNIGRGGGGSVAEGAGAVFGFGLESLFTLASLTTLAAAATLAQASQAIVRPSNANGPLVRTRGNFREARNGVLGSGFQGGTMSNREEGVNGEIGSDEMVRGMSSHTDSNSRNMFIGSEAVQEAGSGRRPGSFKENGESTVVVRNSNLNIVEHMEVMNNAGLDVVSGDTSGNIRDTDRVQYTEEQTLPETENFSTRKETVTSNHRTRHDRGDLFHTTKNSAGSENTMNERATEVILTQRKTVNDRLRPSNGQPVGTLNERTEATMDMVGSSNVPVLPQAEGNNFHNQGNPNIPAVVATKHSYQDEFRHGNSDPVNVSDSSSPTLDLNVNLSNINPQGTDINISAEATDPYKDVISNIDLGVQKVSVKNFSEHSEDLGVTKRPSAEENYSIQRHQRPLYAYSNRRLTDGLAGLGVPAETILRAAVRGESPSFVFGQGFFPSIQRGVVRHIGSFTPTRHRTSHVRLYEARDSRNS